MSFETHKLNDNGFSKLKDLKFDIVALRDEFLKLNESRDRSMAITKLEEASFWASKALASAPENHDEVINY